MHIKTLQIRAEDHTLFCDLQFGAIEAGFGIRVRITRQKRKGGERLIGITAVSKDLQLILPPEDLTPSECKLVQNAIKEAVDPAP